MGRKVGVTRFALLALVRSRLHSAGRDFLCALIDLVQQVLELARSWPRRLERLQRLPTGLDRRPDGLDDDLISGLHFAQQQDDRGRPQIVTRSGKVVRGREKDALLRSDVDDGPSGLDQLRQGLRVGRRTRSWVVWV
jgi:hypothetical protein